MDDYYLEESMKTLLSGLTSASKTSSTTTRPPAGIDSYELDIVENVRGFEIAISRITLGKQQESTEGELIDFVALEVQMRNTNKQ